MNTTAVVITAGVVGLAAGLAVALPYFLQPNYGIILQADRSVISDAKWKNIEDVLNRVSVTPGADARNMLYRVRAFDPHLPPSADVGDLPETLLLGQPDVPQLSTDTPIKSESARSNAHNRSRPMALACRRHTCA